MRWHLGGENSSNAEFVSAGGDYHNSRVWVTQQKNWDSFKNWNE